MKTVLGILIFLGTIMGGAAAISICILMFLAQLAFPVVVLLAALRFLGWF